MPFSISREKHVRDGLNKQKSEMKNEKIEIKMLQLINESMR